MEDGNYILYLAFQREKKKSIRIWLKSKFVIRCNFQPCKIRKVLLDKYFVVVVCIGNSVLPSSDMSIRTMYALNNIVHRHICADLQWKFHLAHNRSNQNHLKYFMFSVWLIIEVHFRIAFYSYQCQHNVGLKYEFKMNIKWI